MEDRRARFRRQMAQLEGAGSPEAAIEAGFYVPRPTSSERMVRRIELEPRAIRVLTGPVGSGKSTELLMIARGLAEVGDLWPLVVDVSRVHDLESLQEGSLVAAAAVWMLEQHGQDGAVLRQLRKRVHGTTLGSLSRALRLSYGSEVVREEDASESLSDLLQPPSAGRDLASQVSGELYEAVREITPRTPVLLFDSLDRLHDAAHFRTVLVKDAVALTQHGFGVVLTAPVDTVWLHAHDLRSTARSWDTLPYEDPAKNPEAFEFLLEILRRRVIDGMIPNEVIDRLVRMSGGVLRDVIELARTAVEEAYLGGRDAVGDEDVSASIARFARGLSLGLDDAALAMLRSVHETGRLERFDDAALRLLKNRQIIEHYAADSYFEVHPVLQPAVERWAAAS